MIFLLKFSVHHNSVASLKDGEAKKNLDGGVHILFQGVTALSILTHHGSLYNNNNLHSVAF